MEPPSVTGAIDRVVDAAQHVVADQVDLARLELRQVLRATARGGTLLLMGAFLLAVAWVSVVVAAYVLLTALPPPQRLGLIAVVNGAAGGVLAFLGVRRLTSPESHGSA